MNKIILFGNLTRDPELSTSASGKSICKFSVATNDKYGDEEETNFFNITAFGQQGETVAKYLKKGRKILLEGRVKISDYERDGVKKRSWDVIMSKFEFVPEGKSNSSSGEGESYQSTGSKTESKSDNHSSIASRPSDDDLPF